VVAAPYLARDLAEVAPAPRWLASPWRRAALAILACIAVGAAEWSRPDYPLGVRMLPLWYPKAACDFMAKHDVRGRGFNHFGLSGYLLYRFWPDRGRLPFMDIHMASLPADRDAYARLLTEDAAWRELDGRYHFDYALLSRRVVRETRLLDVLDADTSFALVFSDDVAGLFVRRSGPMAAVAASEAYHRMPAGGARIPQLQRLCAQDAGACDSLAAELERAVRSSDRNAQAHSFLANIALMRGQLAAASEHLRAALAVDPFTVRAHERLGLIALAESRPAEALREFHAEHRMNGDLPGLDLHVGQAFQRLGDPVRAASAYERELRRNPGSQEARDSLAVVRRAS
jgi:tetratricopeptide (TPR) repeat protein